MTEYVLIAHRKDPASSNRGTKTGMKVPKTTNLDGILGAPQSGAWMFDFATGINVVSLDTPSQCNQ